MWIYVLTSSKKNMFLIKTFVFNICHDVIIVIFKYNHDLILINIGSYISLPLKWHLLWSKDAFHLLESIIWTIFFFDSFDI